MEAPVTAGSHDSSAPVEQDPGRGGTLLRRQARGTAVHGGHQSAWPAHWQADREQLHWGVRLALYAGDDEIGAVTTLKGTGSYPQG